MTTDMAESIIRASELEYRKDTSYQDIDLSNKEIIFPICDNLLEGKISWESLVKQLIKSYPNDQELGRELRKILNKQI